MACGTCKLCVGTCCLRTRTTPRCFGGVHRHHVKSRAPNAQERSRGRRASVDTAERLSMSSHDISAVCRYVAPDQSTKAAEAVWCDIQPSSEAPSPQSSDGRQVPTEVVWVSRKALWF